jgi:hypothetical protein
MFADDTTIPLPALYVEATDPTTVYTDGRSFAKRMWLDTSTGTIGTLKKRNAANDGWDTLINLDAPAPANDSVTNAILANMAQSTIKGRASGAGTGDPADLSAAQVKTILALASGDISGFDAAVDARIKLLQKWSINFTANGDAYIPAYEAMTVDLGTAAIGTGTLAYEKSTTAAPGTFSSTTLPAALQAGAWLKVTVSSITGFKAVELKRTA